MSFEIVEKLKREIAGTMKAPKEEAVGVVVEASDGIARISGLSKALSQELLSIETANGDELALAANLEEHFIGAILLGEASRVRVGDRVRQTGNVLSIPVGKELIGRVVDPLGRALDNRGVIFPSHAHPDRYPLERSAPNVLAREGVKTPLHTGLAAIDAMIPIGRGQRELIIGDRQTGKTAVALDTILNQKHERDRQVICVYVAIGQKQSKVAEIAELLRAQGAMDYSIIVAASASSPSALQYLAPFAGAAIGEFFMDQGRDALVIYDDLSKHAIAYRELSLLLKRPPGREAYPGDIFYLHSRLLERAAKLSKELGGGSLTALPIIETQLGDVSAYIPTNVISITDGQIYLESNLFYQGVRPAVNVGLSVSRVGSSAQTKAMKKVAGRLRLELAQFRELAAFVQFASDLDERTKERISRGELLTEILKQPDRAPIPFEEEVLILYGALSGYFDGIALGEVNRVSREAVEFMKKLHADDIVTPLKTTRELSEDVEKKLKVVYEEFRRTKNIA